MAKIPRIQREDLYPEPSVPLTQEAIPAEDDALLRWRLILGGGDADGTSVALDPLAQALDDMLNMVYEEGESAQRSGSLSASAPKIAAWLEDIRRMFPREVVELLQRDAVEHLGLDSLLLEPEILEQMQADVSLVSTLMALRELIPERARQAARQLVQQVVSELERQLKGPMQQALRGSLMRNARNVRPRHQEMDWLRTIRANLKHYQRDYRTIIPERRIGFGRRQNALKSITLCVDQSASMGTSVIYSCVFASAMVSLRALKTRLVCFDTSIVDYSDQLYDPVELLFGVQLGGGTDIRQALDYCQAQIQQPNDHTLVLISDLYEGGNAQLLLESVARVKHAGTQLIVLLALNDQGAPVYNKALAQQLAQLDIPVFACSAEHFPGLMAAALNREDLQHWAGSVGLQLSDSGP